MNIPWTEVIEITAAFIPFHQGLIEVWKLFGTRTRRYWEALTYIVYGDETGSGKNNRSIYVADLRTPYNFLKGFVVGIPTTFREEYRKRFIQSGSQIRLIQSFLLRAVGDSPVTEVSDADIRNVSDIARLSSTKGVQDTAAALDEIIRSEIRNPQDVLGILKAVKDTLDRENDKELIVILKKWLEVIEQEGEDVSPALLYIWRVQFIESFLPGVVRAERELGNALKAAEFRYHRQLRSVSAFLALLEAIGINFFVAGYDNLNIQIVGTLFGFGALVLGSEAGKGLLQSIVGISARLRR